MKVERELIPWRTPFNAWELCQREDERTRYPAFFGEGEQAGAPWTSWGGIRRKSRLRDQTASIVAICARYESPDVHGAPACSPFTEEAGNEFAHLPLYRVPALKGVRHGMRHVLPS